MDEFFTANPGFRARVAHRIDFPDYTQPDLMAIADMTLTQRNHRFDDPARTPVTTDIDARMRQILASRVLAP